MIAMMIGSDALDYMRHIHNIGQVVVHSSRLASRLTWNRLTQTDLRLIRLTLALAAAQADSQATLP